MTPCCRTPLRIGNRERDGYRQPLLRGERGRQIAEFGFYFGRVGHGIRDLLAKEFAIPLAKPVNRNFEGTLRGVHLASQLCISRIGMPKKEHLQPLEMHGLAVLDELFAQFLHDPVEDRKRPAPLEDALGRFVVRRFALIMLLAGAELKGYKLPAAALARALAIFLVGDKELHGTQKKRPEPAFFR